MKKPLLLPKFKNEDEEVEFWDKVDITEYFEPSDFKRGVIFPNLKRTRQPASSPMSSLSTKPDKKLDGEGS